MKTGFGIRSQKSEVNPPLLLPGGEVGYLRKAPKIFRLKRWGCATHVILIKPIWDLFKRESVVSVGSVGRWKHYSTFFPYSRS
ncbi:MAG: hypothetical protein F6K39_12455 [Okeania sp. SIO3B3]|nr:hypothetical protein [Okeania sp. SIO3B3]